MWVMKKEKPEVKKFRTRHMPMQVHDDKKRKYNRAKHKQETVQEIELFTLREHNKNVNK